MTLTVTGMVSRQLLAGGWLALVLLPTNAFGSAADNLTCIEANRFLESSECINDRQRELDRLIADGYARMVARLGRPAANRIQIPFMRMRLMCGADIRCDYRWQISQLATYDQLMPIGQKGLSANVLFVHHQKLREALRSGECLLSTAVAVSCWRASGGTCTSQPGPGSLIVLADDFRGLAAENSDAVFNTRKGDPILACKGPPAANCGRDGPSGHMWQLTNHRTGDSWQVADKDNTCGPFTQGPSGN